MAEAKVSQGESANERIPLSQVVRDELRAHIQHDKDRRGEHKEEHKEMEKQISEFAKLVPYIRLIMAVGAILGTSLAALIWSMLTGQVQLVFP